MPSDGHRLTWRGGRAFLPAGLLSLSPRYRPPTHATGRFSMPHGIQLDMAYSNTDCGRLKLLPRIARRLVGRGSDGDDGSPRDFPVESDDDGVEWESLPGRDTDEIIFVPSEAALDGGIPFIECDRNSLDDVEARR